MNAGTPVVAVPKLDRPLVLTNVVDRATAVMANYGVSDEVLLETLFGERSPRGNLPFELPRSMDQVEQQLEDVPDDIANPLFPPRIRKAVPLIEGRLRAAVLQPAPSVPGNEKDAVRSRRTSMFDAGGATLRWCRLT